MTRSDAPHRVARELRALVIATTVLAGGSAFALQQALRHERPTVYYALPDGRTLHADELHQGAPRTGNAPAMLDEARQVGRSLAAWQANLAPTTLNASLLHLDSAATVRGRRVLRQSLPRSVLATWILVDQGRMSAREYGSGAVASGAGKDTVRVAVPMTGWYYSRHVPFTGPYTGIPLRGMLNYWMVRGYDGRWRLDSLEGSLLDTATTRLWTRYRTELRPMPLLVVRGVVVAPDSIRRVAWREITPYGKF